MLRLRVFGGLAIERDGVPVTAMAQQDKALALVAVVAAGGERGVRRDRLAAFLWPESDAQRARGALSQTLYMLRKQLAEPELFTGAQTLWLNARAIECDLWDFQAALVGGDLETAVSLYTGPFLDGFFVSGSTELEGWITGERASLARRVTGALELLARTASEHGNLTAAVTWWRRLIELDPGNARVAVALMTAVANAGDRAGALQAARAHEGFMRLEYEAPPDPAVSALAEEIRMRSNGAAGQPHARESLSVANIAPAPSAVPNVTIDTAPPTTPTRGAAGQELVRVAAFAVVSVAVIVFVTLAARRSDDQTEPALSERRVAVTAFENLTGDTALASIGRIASDWVVQGLAQTQLLEVVGPGVRARGVPSLGRKAPSAAGLIVRGSYSRVADTLLVQAQVVEATSGSVIRAVGPVPGPLDEPLVAIERLRQRLAGALATRVDARLSRWSDAASQPASFEAYRALDEGLSAFFARDDPVAYAQAGRLLLHAAALDSTFNLPLLWAVYAFGNASDLVRRDSVLRVLESRRERLPPFDRALLDAHVADAQDDAIRKYEALRRLVTIAPRSEWLYKAAVAAQNINRYAEADSLLDALDPNAGWIREWPLYWDARADMAYVGGRHDAELAAVLRRNERYPLDDYRRRQQGRALAALGRDRELLAWVDAGMAHSPPELDAEALFRIINAARVHGRLEVARAIAERALRSGVTVGDMSPDTALARARFRVLVLEAVERWDEAAAGARHLIQLDSLEQQRDALPYIVLLQAAREGATGDTAGLEARALAEAAARSPADGKNSWKSEHPVAVRAALAALHHDAPTALATLREARNQGVWEYFWYSERPVFDRLRGDAAFKGLLHACAGERGTLSVAHR
jgi:DNA-binding SARP family transcriptional activator/TolB-like protein